MAFVLYGRVRAIPTYRVYRLYDKHEHGAASLFDQHEDILQVCQIYHLCIYVHNECCSKYTGYIYVPHGYPTCPVT